MTNSNPNRLDQIEALLAGSVQKSIEHDRQLEGLLQKSAEHDQRTEILFAALDQTNQVQQSMLLSLE